MIECLIIGDSIAVGVQQFKPECATYSKVGITSKNWNKAHGNKALSAKNVIISLGSNDHTGIHSFKELMSIRTRTDADHVYWILPAINPNVQDHVQIIAKNYGDTVLVIPELAKDGVHPTRSAYKQMSREIK